MQEIDNGLFPSSNDIWYAGQLKAFAAQLPTIAGRYNLSAVTVLNVQNVALELMELLIHRMNHAAEHLRYCQGTALINLQMQSVLADNWHRYQSLLQKFVQEVVNHIRQHKAYTATDEIRLGLENLGRQPSLEIDHQELGH